MPWAAIAGGAASLGGALIGSRSARRAADAQAAAAREALAEQRRQFDIGVELQRPFHEQGVDAVRELGGYRFSAPTAADVMNDPGYAFGLQEGRNALEGSAAARGGLFSGNALKALTRYGTDYGTTKFNDAFERARSTYATNANTLGNLINAGTGAATNMQQAGANFATNAGNLLTGAANAQGAAGIARGNIWSDALNQAVSIGNRNNWWQNPQNFSRGGGGTGSFDYTPNPDGSSPGGAGFGYADGGPVMLVEVEPGRFEPRVGSRSARRSGGGGGLSNENVLRALAAAAAASEPSRSGMGALPANPVTNPGGLRRLQMEAAGAYADGGPVMDPDMELHMAKRSAVFPRGGDWATFIASPELDARIGELDRVAAGGRLMIGPGLDPTTRAIADSELQDMLVRRAMMNSEIARRRGAGGSGQGYKDGGPVMEMRDGRMVPKVGTRSPRPGSGGTGGGMSREQVLAALTAAQAASAPSPAGRTGVGALPVNPVTNPGGLRRVQVEQAAGYCMGGAVKAGRKDYQNGGVVRGPGGPRDDAVPAWLSNGEHVMDAQTVTAMGGGSNALGQRKLNALRAMLQEV